MRRGGLPDDQHAERQTRGGLRADDLGAEQGAGGAARREPRAADGRCGRQDDERPTPRPSRFPVAVAYA